MAFVHAGSWFARSLWENLPGRIDEADGVHVKGAVDGIEDGHFAKRLHGEQQHDADDDETKEL